MRGPQQTLASGGNQMRNRHQRHIPSNPPLASDPQSLAFHCQLNDEEYKPILPGPPISKLERDIPKSEDYCVYKVAFQFRKGAQKRPSSTLPNHFWTGMEAIEAALALAFNAGFGDAQESTDIDMDGVQIFKRGPDADGRFMWVWVEKYYIQATPVPEKHNRKAWTEEFNNRPCEDENHNPHPWGFHGQRR